MLFQCFCLKVSTESHQKAEFMHLFMCPWTACPKYFRGRQLWKQRMEDAANVVAEADTDLIVFPQNPQTCNTDTIKNVWKQLS